MINTGLFGPRVLGPKVIPEAPSCTEAQARKVETV